MPKYKVRYTFDVVVDAPSESIAWIEADFEINPDCASYLLKYLIDKKIINIEIPEDLKEEIENGKDIALSFEFKEKYNPITDEFVADEFIKDENLRKMIWPEDENKVFLPDDSEMIKIEDAKTKKPSELYAQRMHMSGIKYTCTDCPDCAKCKYAFDNYCTNGNCLVEK